MIVETFPQGGCGNYTQPEQEFMGWGEFLEKDT